MALTPTDLIYHEQLSCLFSFHPSTWLHQLTSTLLPYFYQSYQALSQALTESAVDSSLSLDQYQQGADQCITRLEKVMLEKWNQFELEAMKKVFYFEPKPMKEIQLIQIENQVRERFEKREQILKLKREIFLINERKQQLAEEYQRVQERLMRYKRLKGTDQIQVVVDACSGLIPVMERLMKAEKNQNQLLPVQEEEFLSNEMNLQKNSAAALQEWRHVLSQ